MFCNIQANLHGIIFYTIFKSFIFDLQFCFSQKQGNTQRISLRIRKKSLNVQQATGVTISV
jgi:hypothetical protein